MPINKENIVWDKPDKIEWDEPKASEIVWDEPKASEIVWDEPKASEIVWDVSSTGPSLPSMPKDGPEKRPPVLNQLKVHGLLEGMPVEMASELKKASLEYDREGGAVGSIRMPETSIPKTMIEGFKNIPENIDTIVKETSSMVMMGLKGVYGLGKNAIKDINEAVIRSASGETDILPESRTMKQLYGVGKFPGAIYDAIKSEVKEAKTMGTDQYLHRFVRERPVDALFLVGALRAAAGGTARLGLKSTRKVMKNGTKFADGLDDILSTKRSPLVYEMPAEVARGGPEASRMTSKQIVAKSFEFPREYSKDPIVKYIYQKSFDKVLDKYPAMKQNLAEVKAGKLLTELRKTYDSANVQERIKMHKLIDEQLATLSKDELRVMVPYLEGRASLLGGQSKAFDDFEGWYRSTMKTAEKDLLERGVFTPERVEELLYGPMSKASGKNIDQVKAEFGDFTPAYVHELHPQYPKKMNAEFADITGKRAKVGILKRRKVGVGYSENMKEILPKWSSEYIRFKNTEAFINEFTNKFGIPANIKNVKQVEGGFKVGDKTYKGYRIVAPDGYLRFYQGKIDIYKQVSKKLDDLEFDEAIGTVIKETVGDVKETSRVVSKAGAEMSRQSKLIQGRIEEALKARGFGVGEAEQMIERIKTSGVSGLQTVYNEKEYTKIREIIKTSGLDPDKLKESFRGAEKSYVGVAKNQTVYLVPENIAKNLESWATPIFGSQKAQNFIKLVYDKPIGVWKDAVLAASPRWIKNNTMGDVLFNTMEGVGPLSYSRAFSAKYTRLIPDELLKASFAETMKYNPKLGLAAKNQFGKMAERLGKTKIVKGAAKVKDFAYAVNTAIEQPFVRALYVKESRALAKKLLRKENQIVNESSILYKMEEIKNSETLRAPLIKKVKETLPVFDLSGNFERKYLKRVMPFYNWYKFMAVYAAKLPEKHPFKLVGARGLGALSEIEREQAFSLMFPFMKGEIERNGIPNRYDHLWPIEYPDKNNEARFFNVRGMNPFTTVTDFAEGDFINLLSPIVKVFALERPMGQNLFMGRKFEDAEQGRGKFKEFKKVTPPLFDHILSQFPQYQLLKQTFVPTRQWDSGTIFNPEPKLDKITGEYKYPINNVEKLFNYMGVDNKTLDIKKTWMQFQNAKNTAIGETFLKDQSRFEKYATAEEIVELLNYIKGDEKKWDEIITKMQENKKYKVEQKRELADKIRSATGETK